MSFHFDGPFQYGCVFQSKEFFINKSLFQPVALSGMRIAIVLIIQHENHTRASERERSEHVDAKQRGALFFLYFVCKQIS